MVMMLSDAQMDSMADELLLDRVTAILLDSYPQARAALTSSAVRTGMAEVLERARGYGFKAELDLARFLITAWIMGADFDTRYAAMAELLALPGLSPTQKAEAIESTTATLLANLDAGAPS